MRALFITGTDTGVGKTHVVCCIAQQLASAGLRVGAYKPVCSGAERNSVGELVWDDLERLKLAINVPASPSEICPQRFLAPLAPPAAARLEQRVVDERLLHQGLADWRARTDHLLIEGAGGLLCPLTDSMTIGDLAAAWQAPILIVARPGLGTINHTLLTIEAARQRRLQIAGVVCCETHPGAVDAAASSNGAEIERWSGVPVLGTFPYGNSPLLLHGGIPVDVHWQLLMQDVPQLRESATHAD